jgi:hypothetical protein
MDSQLQTLESHHFVSISRIWSDEFILVFEDAVQILSEINTDILIVLLIPFSVLYCITVGTQV